MPLPQTDLADAWAAGRPEPRLTHLDSAAAGRSSHAVQARVARHLREESELGGYVAAAAVVDELAAARAGLGRLLGHRGEDVLFTCSAQDALSVLLRAWPTPPGARVFVAPGEYGPNLAEFDRAGWQVTTLPVADGVGHLDVAATAELLAADPPDLVHLTPLASHRGVAQDLAGVPAASRAAGVPLVVDAAQALGHLDCTVGADAVYATSRKWLAGPRGVGVLAVAPDTAARLTRPLVELEPAEAFVAGRLGLGVAVAEHLALGPARIRERLCAIGADVRRRLDGVGGWRVVEPVDEPTATTTLLAPPGVSDDAVAALRQSLLDDGVLTTFAGTVRAPREATRAVLRLSPHLDYSPDHLVVCERKLAL